MIWLIWACAQASEEPWFLEHPLTVTPEGVGGVLQVRVTRARGYYWVWLSDPSGATRRSEEVSPAVGIYFTHTADQAGTWTVSVGKPFASGVSALVEFTLSPGSGGGNGDGDSCGLLGLEAILILLAIRSRRRRSARVT